MNNYEVIRKYRKIKMVRRRIEKVGSFFLGIGFLGLIVVSGDNSTLTLGQLCIWALCSTFILGIGFFILRFLENLEEDYPITLKLVDKGGRLCYTIYNTKQKASVYND